MEGAGAAIFRWARVAFGRAAAAFVPGVADTKITKWTPLGVSAAQTSLVLAVLWEYLGLFAALAQQLTGCLGLPANPFVLRRKQN